MVCTLAALHTGALAVLPGLALWLLWGAVVVPGLALPAGIPMLAA